MKNRYLFLLLWLFFNITCNISANEINFESGDIQILENGNVVEVENGVAHSADVNLKIKADKFNYNKSQSILRAYKSAVATLLSRNITIDADSFTYNQKLSTLNANGNVIVNDLTNSISLESNEIFYDIKTQILKSKSKSKIIHNPGNLILSKNFTFLLNDNLIKVNDLELMDIQKNVLKIDKAFINTISKKIIGKDVSVNLNNQSFEKDNEPRIKGNAVRINSDETLISKGVFTTCKKNADCPPWQLSAKEIRHDKKNKTIYYKDAWLKVYDQPVFYFPKFFHPDPTIKRRSGFLMPTFETVSNNSTTFHLPYFFAASESKDFTFTPRFYSNKKILAQTEYREVNKNSTSFMDFSFLTENSHSNENHFFLDSTKVLDFYDFDYSQLKINVESVNGDTYLKNYKLKSPIIKDLNTLQSSISLETSKENLFFDLDFYRYENLSKKNSDRFEYILPSYNLTKNLDYDEKLDGAISLSSSGYMKNYETNILEKVIVNDILFSSSSSRTNSGIKNQHNILLKNVNTDSKNSSKYKTDTNHEISSIIEYNSSYPLKKETENSTNIFKPTVSLRYSPNKNKNMRTDERRIDNENIFSLNRLSQKDSVEGGASLTYGVEFLKENSLNREILGLKMANILRVDENEQLPINSSVGKKTSDIFGSISFNPNKYLSTEYQFAQNSNLKDVNYQTLNGELSINNFVTSFEYLNENNTQSNESYLTNKTSYQLNKSSNLIFETRDNKKTNLTEFYNLMYQYRNDCLIAAIDYNKEYYTDKALKPSESIFLKLTIIPFGQTSSPSLIK